MIRPALEQGGYEFKRQVKIGNRLGGQRKHFVDWLVEEKKGNAILVSAKWQQSSGTAEQKVPFEIMCLADAVSKSEGRFRKAYLVLGGDGWTLRDFYLGDGLNQYLSSCESVQVMTLEAFVAKANQGKL